MQKINLAELKRMTGISRSRLRRLKENNFQVQPHGRTGMHASNTVLTGFTGILDLLLQNSINRNINKCNREQIPLLSIAFILKFS